MSNVTTIDEELDQRLHWQDYYALELEFSDQGRKVCWDSLPACRTVRDVLELMT